MSDNENASSSNNTGQRVNVDNVAIGQEANNVGQHDPNQLGGQQQLQIARISMRAPPFWKENPALWFLQLESQFITNGITSSDTKYHIAVAALETAIINQVSDVVLRPPPTHKYETLKTRLQERFAESEERRFKKLLGNIDLGDRLPSHLWREMRELAGEAFDEDLLKSLWLKRLQPHAQAILSTSNENIARLLTMADKIHEVIDTRDVHSIAINSANLQPLATQSPKSDFEKLCAQVSELTRQVSALSTSRNSRTRERSTSRYRQRSSSRHYKQGQCWYHDQFGPAAKKCLQPCSFKSEN